MIMVIRVPILITGSNSNSMFKFQFHVPMIIVKYKNPVIQYNLDSFFLIMND